MRSIACISTLRPLLAAALVTGLPACGSSEDPVDSTQLPSQEAVPAAESSVGTMSGTPITPPEAPAAPPAQAPGAPPQVQPPVGTPAVPPQVQPPVGTPAVPETPAVEEPAVEEPAVEEPAVEEPAVEEPAVEEPAVEEPAVEEPPVGEPAAPAMDPGKLVGWAADERCGANGTTGGGDGPPTITVTSGGEFRNAMESDGPAVIEISGTIEFSGGLSASNKTVIGTNNAEVSGNISMSGSKNLIFKNILFKNPKMSGGIDTLEVSGCTCIWFDHCEFADGTDGNLDIVRASDLITVSWSKFYYTFGHGHMLSNLCGNKNNNSQDEGKINITFHHNLWGAGVRSRAPRVRYGKVHVFNNYYKYEDIPGGGGDNSKVAAGQHSKVLVENNYFEDIKRPMQWQGDEGTAEMAESGNVYVRCGSEGLSRGAAFTPAYDYTLDDGMKVKDIVLAGAGRK